MANRNLEDLLASDDELPNAYEEDADLPAYQNDNRFDIIDFPWINNKEVIEHSLPNSDVSSRSSSDSKDITQSARALRSTNYYYDKEESRDKMLLKKGILNKRDIFCVKCVAAFSTDTTLIWFINFLMLKDMQSDYNFLKSCLVEDVHENSSEKDVLIDCEMHYYQIIVK